MTISWLSLYIFLVFLTATSFPSTLAESINCSQALTFSSCISFIGTSVTNADSPSRQCCNDFIADFINDLAICVCQRAMEPQFNSTRIFSLPGLCTRTTRGNFTEFCTDDLSPSPLEPGIDPAAEPSAQSQSPEQPVADSSNQGGSSIGQHAASDSSNQGGSPMGPNKFTLVWWLLLSLLLFVVFLLCLILYLHQHLHQH